MYCVSIMCRNDELSWLLTNRFRAYLYIGENSQILLKISVIPILLTFIYLVKAILRTNVLNDVTAAPFSVCFFAAGS